MELSTLSLRLRHTNTGRAFFASFYSTYLPQSFATPVPIAAAMLQCSLTWGCRNQKISRSLFFSLVWVHHTARFRVQWRMQNKPSPVEFKSFPIWVCPQLKPHVWATRRWWLVAVYCTYYQWYYYWFYSCCYFFLFVCLAVVWRSCCYWCYLIFCWNALLRGTLSYLQSHRLLVLPCPDSSLAGVWRKPADEGRWSKN